MSDGGVKRGSVAQDHPCQLCGEPSRVRYRKVWLCPVHYQTLSRDTPPGAQITVPDTYFKADPNY